MIVYIILLLIHAFGGIFYLIKNCKNGNMEYAVKHGDGIRFAQPCDIVFDCIILWEIVFVAEFMDKIGNAINFCFKKLFKF